MADQKRNGDRQVELDPKDKDVIPADQAEGERNGETSAKVTRTPGQAEGDRETVDESLRDQERKDR